MRTLLVLTLLSAPALADVGPRPPSCTVPTGCRTCLRMFGDADAGHECFDDAADAGLHVSECTDRVGASQNEYWCPTGVEAKRPTSCGCATPAAPLALALLLGLRLTIRSKRG